MNEALQLRAELMHDALVAAIRSYVDLYGPQENGPLFRQMLGSLPNSTQFRLATELGFLKEWQQWK